MVPAQVTKLSTLVGITVPCIRQLPDELLV